MKQRTQQYIRGKAIINSGLGKKAVNYLMSQRKFSKKLAEKTTIASYNLAKSSSIDGKTTRMKLSLLGGLFMHLREDMSIYDEIEMM